MSWRKHETSGRSMCPSVRGSGWAMLSPCSFWLLMLCNSIWMMTRFFLCACVFVVFFPPNLSRDCQPDTTSVLCSELSVQNTVVCQASDCEELLRLLKQCSLNLEGKNSSLLDFVYIFRITLSKDILCTWLCTVFCCLHMIIFHEKEAQWSVGSAIL